jgi:uncharacterized protein (DUF302 family)
MSTFGLRKELHASFDDALAQVPEALKAEGFGVLTDIDIQSTLKAKLGVDFRRFKILGACNPAFAHEALREDLAAGLFLPCNVVVYEKDDGHAVVSAVDPTRTVATMGNAKLVELAEQVREKLARAISRME